MISFLCGSVQWNVVLFVLNAFHQPGLNVK